MKVAADKATGIGDSFKVSSVRASQCCRGKLGGGSMQMAHLARPVVAYCLHELFLDIHHKGTFSCHRLVDRLAIERQYSRSSLASIETRSP